MTDNQRAYEAAICEVAHVSDIGDVSDGFHTFNQLYHQRAMLFAALVNQNRDISWKTRKHEDGEPCFGGGWFLVTIDTPDGPYGYHYEEKYWDMFHCKELERAKHWDGYTEEDVGRLMSLPDTVTSAANLIDRDALMKEICDNECGCVCDEECENVMCNYYGYIMMDAPIIKTETAEWIYAIDKCWLFATFTGKNIVKCSKCGNTLDMNGVNAGRGDANFCPNCGKKMNDNGRTKTVPHREANHGN